MIPRVAIFWRVISKKAAAMPVPIPKPITPTVNACSSTMPVSRQFVDAYGLQSAELLQIFERKQ